MENNLKENDNLRLKSIAELLDGKHRFIIPSYQRGYRWERKQVEDLLKDIWDFARNDENKKTDFYCLQPVVVKRDDEGWIVIDGQQRLTTLLLLLNFIKNDSRTPFVKKADIYGIEYRTRKDLDFTNPDKSADIDSYHVFNNKEIIKEWFEDRIDEIDYAALERVLFNKSPDVPKVKIIWYITESDKEIDSIKTFNNLNRGKIKLTNAELIKALFILKSQEIINGKSVEKLNVNAFSYEWNEIENRLHDDKFWHFLANKDYTPATRIDIIFDFLTRRPKKSDEDFSYRLFQQLYDGTDNGFWDKKGVSNFTEAWLKVKEVYHTFLYWYEDSYTYHYIGFLIYFGESLNTIYDKCKGKAKSEVKDVLRALISEKYLNFHKNEIDDFSYSENHYSCKKILTFFNIETIVQQQQELGNKIGNIDSHSYYKFPFYLFKQYNWDIEHVSSQKDNPLKNVKDKKIWLGYIPSISHKHNEWKDIQGDAATLLKKLEDKGKDEKNEFDVLYNRIINIIEKDNKSITKDTIDNLTLLDESTNRGYGNALFQTKRATIIKNDKEGVFIPVCTKNLFLKYYTSDDMDQSQWKNNWEDNDRANYLKAIHNVIDDLLIKTNNESNAK